MLSRRDFSKFLISGKAAALASLGHWHPNSNASPNQTQAPATQDIDLLIKDGTIIDPGQKLHTVADVAIKQGKVLEISPNISEKRALQVFSAKNRIVTPGLIDLHVHCFDGVGVCINADHYCLSKGVTTVIDAGSAGYSLIANFRKYVMSASATRIKALVNISPLGQVVGADKAWEKMEWLDPALAAEAAKTNAQDVLGIKVQLGGPEQGARDKEVLNRALRAAEIAQTPLMAHIDLTYSTLPELLSPLRKGDVYTHFLNGHPHGILDENGRLLPVAREARARGVFFDVGQGSVHLSFAVAQTCLDQGFPPDTLSTDLNQRAVLSQVYDLPTMVSKFVALGISLDDAIRMVTFNPTQIFDFREQIGTLRPGSEGDVAIFELQEGKCEFADSEGKTIVGRQKLVSSAVVRHGQLFNNMV